MGVPAHRVPPGRQHKPNHVILRQSILGSKTLKAVPVVAEQPVISCYPRKAILALGYVDCQIGEAAILPIVLKRLPCKGPHKPEGSPLKSIAGCFLVTRFR